MLPSLETAARILSHGLMIGLLGSYAARSAHAQDNTAEAMLDCFTRAYSFDPHHPGHGDVRCDGALRLGLTAVVHHPDDYPDLFEPIMDGLEQLATHHSYHGVRYAAAVFMMSPGDDEYQDPNPGGVMQRVRQVYEESDDPSVRALLINMVPRQAEIQEATDFLVDAATSKEYDLEMMFQVQLPAVNALARTDHGRRALGELSATGVVTSEAGRNWSDCGRTGSGQSVRVRSSVLSVWS